MMSCEHLSVSQSASPETVHYVQLHAPPDAHADKDYFVSRLCDLVINRFLRLCSTALIRAQLDRNALPAAWCITSPHVVPSGTEFPRQIRCHNDWQWILARMRLHPEVYRSHCAAGPTCASVPLVWNDRSIVVLQFVDLELKSEQALSRTVELLEILVENFKAREYAFLVRMSAAQGGAASEWKSYGLHCSTERAAHGLHRNVLRTLQYIDEHLADPDLSASEIAGRLETNASYLSHLFSQQLHLHMSRYIIERRIDRAKRYLSGTQWQVKRVARECGFASSDWFSHTFHEHVGLTPTQFRQREPVS